MPIDWTQLSSEDGELGGDSLAKKALATILGDEEIYAAVEHYISGKLGAELARSVLWLLRPRSAMEFCYNIFRKDENLENRRTAIKLLRVVADESVLPWIPEFLNDPDEAIQTWGAGVLDQLIFSNFVDIEDCSELLEQMKTHDNPGVQRYYRLCLGQTD